MLILALALAGCQTSNSATDVAPASSDAGTSDVYTYKKPSRDGIGKFYHGREISQVMGFLGASWLEREQREREERTDLLVRSLGLEPHHVVADIGAGTGYFTFRMSPLVPDGKVLAVDIQAEMLEVIEERQTNLGVTNVEGILGTEKSPNLPEASVDLVLMVDAYHEFNWPYEMMLNIVQSLRPGGRVVLVEYRGEDPTVPIKELHKMTVAQCRREMKAVGLKLQEKIDVLPQQHILIFEKG